MREGLACLLCLLACLPACTGVLPEGLWLFADKVKATREGSKILCLCVEFRLGCCGSRKAGGEAAGDTLNGHDQIQAHQYIRMCVMYVHFTGKLSSRKGCWLASHVRDKQQNYKLARSK